MGNKKKKVVYPALMQCVQAGQLNCAVKSVIEWLLLYIMIKHGDEKFFQNNKKIVCLIEDKTKQIHFQLH